MRLLKIKALDNIRVIQKYIHNKTYDEFISDDKLIDAVMFRLIQLILKYPDKPTSKNQRYKRIK